MRHGAPHEGRGPGRGWPEHGGWDAGRGFGPPRFGWGGGRGRMRRGDIRTAVLAVLAEEPGHGYDVMGRLEAKSGGTWRPSAGSVYPTLQQLDDEGLVASAERDGKKVYTITDAGRAEAARRLEESGEPWADAGDAEGSVHPGRLFRSFGALGMAARQVVHAGTRAQLAATIEIVDRARKDIYRLLGDDAPTPEG